MELSFIAYKCGSELRQEHLHLKWIEGRWKRVEVESLINVKARLMRRHFLNEVSGLKLFSARVFIY